MLHTIFFSFGDENLYLFAPYGAIKSTLSPDSRKIHFFVKSTKHLVEFTSFLVNFIKFLLNFTRIRLIIQVSFQCKVF